MLYGEVILVIVVYICESSNSILRIIESVDVPLFAGEVFLQNCFVP